MSPEVVIGFVVAGVFIVLGFILGTFLGARSERERWERRITSFADYLEKTPVPLKIEKDVCHTVATALRLFSKRETRYN